MSDLPSLDRLEAALERFETIVGLYLAPRLRAMLEDPEAPADKALVVGFTRAYWEVRQASDAALGVEREGWRGNVGRELAELIERERRWATSAGYQRGKAEEGAARMDQEPSRFPCARARRQGPPTVEPHLQAW